MKHKGYHRISELCSQDRLKLVGSAALTDQELYALIADQFFELIPQNVAIKKIKQLFQRTSSEIPTYDQLMNIADISEDKALSLITLLEFSSRMTNTNKGVNAKTPNQVYNFVKPFAFTEEQSLLVLTISGSDKVINCRNIPKSRKNLIPSILYLGIRDQASGIILSQNYDSNSVSPSVSDIQLSKKIMCAGAMVGMPLMDHLIIGRDGFFSFRQSNFLEE